MFFVILVNLSTTGVPLSLCINFAWPRYAWVGMPYDIKAHQRLPWQDNPILSFILHGLVDATQYHLMNDLFPFCLTYFRHCCLGWMESSSFEMHCRLSFWYFLWIWIVYYYCLTWPKCYLLPPFYNKILSSLLYPWPVLS